jgi:hypothetical protein
MFHDRRSCLLKPKRREPLSHGYQLPNGVLALTGRRLSPVSSPPPMSFANRLAARYRNKA